MTTGLSSTNCQGADSIARGFLIAFFVSAVPASGLYFAAHQLFDEPVTSFSSAEKLKIGSNSVDRSLVQLRTQKTACPQSSDL